MQQFIEVCIFKAEVWKLMIFNPCTLNEILKALHHMLAEQIQVVYVLFSGTAGFK
jgi:hypothetical protein